MIPMTNNHQPPDLLLSDDDDPPAEVRLLVLDQERAMWKNTRYQAQLRHKVQKLLDATPDQLAPLEADVERCVRALEQLAEERLALVSEIEDKKHGR